tara:strand:+ start:71 stop:430 length:360 start_codon:yes stop_codon:yes gene_type:complete
LSSKESELYLNFCEEYLYSNVTENSDVLSNLVEAAQKKLGITSFEDEEAFCEVMTMILLGFKLDMMNSLSQSLFNFRLDYNKLAFTEVKQLLLREVEQLKKALDPLFIMQPLKDVFFGI